MVPITLSAWDWRTDEEAARQAYNGFYSDVIEHGVYGTADEVYPYAFSLTRQELGELKAVSVELCRILGSMPARLGEPDLDELCELLHLGGEQEWIGFRSDPPTHWALSRPDLCLSGGVAKVLEFNIDSALGGLGTMDALALTYRQGIALATPQNGLTSLSTLGTFANYVRSQKTRNDRDIDLLILDWEDEIERNPYSYYAMVDELTSQGLRVAMADQHGISYRDGSFYAGDLSVEVIYRGLTPIDNLLGWDTLTALKQALRDQAVQMISDMRCRVYSCKIWLAYLSDPRYSHLFSMEEHAFLDRHIPWTRRLTREVTDYRGQQAALNDIALRDRGNFVVKPANEGGSKDLYIGPDTEAELWAEVIDQAIERGDYVIQELVQADPVSVQLFKDGHVHCETHRMVVSPFLVGMQMVGVCVRGKPMQESWKVSCLYGAREGTAMQR